MSRKKLNVQPDILILTGKKGCCLVFAAVAVVVVVILAAVIIVAVYVINLKNKQYDKLETFSRDLAPFLLDQEV